MPIYQSAVEERLKSSTRTYWVKPDASIRTTDGIFPLPVQGTDLVFWGLPQLHILPGPLDILKAKDALSKTLAYFPHASGVLRRNGDKWWIVPSQRGVSLTIAATAEEHDHYLLQDAPPSHLIDSVSMDLEGPASPTWDEPLSKFRITTCTTGETYIGLCSSHVLGDAGFLYTFLATWSHFYQDLKPEKGFATFDTYTNPPPKLSLCDPDSFAFITEYLPHMEKLYPVEEFMAMIGNMMRTTERVDLSFSASQVEQLKLIASMPNERTKRVRVGRISGQDALSAYVVTVFNRCQDVPVRRMSNIFSYRQTCPPENANDWKPPGSESVGNAIFQAFTEELSEEDSKSISAVAWAIRKSIVGSRNYEYARKAAALSCATFGEMASKKTEHRFWQEDGGMTFNSVAKLCYSDAHFGFGTHRVRSLLYGAFAGYIRFFHANPTLLADGKTWNANDGAVWMSLRVPSTIKDRFLATICLDLNSPVFPQNLIKREMDIEKMDVTQEIVGAQE